MSAMVCGKRSVFDDSIYDTPPSLTKRARCGRQTSPLRSPWSVNPFQQPPTQQQQHQEQGNSVLDPRLGSSSVDAEILHEEASTSNVVDNHGCTPASVPAVVDTQAAAAEAERAGSEGLTAKWADAAVREMMTAADVNDARQRALLVLQAFEKESVTTKQQDLSAAFASQAEQERLSASNVHALQQQVAVLNKENQILKRAVAIQHEKQKDHQAQHEENARLRQALTQYQEQVHKLEVANYALNLHLRQANDAVNHAALSGRYHPDVF